MYIHIHMYIYKYIHGMYVCICCITTYLPTYVLQADINRLTSSFERC